MNDQPRPKIAYKVLTAEEFAALQQAPFDGAPVDLQDGYIHLSTAAQLSETVARHFKGQVDLVVAAIDLQALADQIRWEVSRNNELFPHLYGRLEKSAVVASCALVWEGSAVRLP